MDEEQMQQYVPEETQQPEFQEQPQAGPSFSPEAEVGTSQPEAQTPNPTTEIANQVALQVLSKLGELLGRTDLNVDVQTKGVYTLAQTYEKLTAVQAMPQEISAEDQMQLEVAKLQMEQQLEQQKFQLEVQKMQMEMELKQQQAAQDAQIKQQQSEMQMRHTEEAHQNAQRQQEESHVIGHQQNADKHEHNKKMDGAKLQLAAKAQQTKSIQDK